MNILGISIYGQNPAACILSDGVVVACAEEERFCRIKSANGRFPTQAIKFCLAEAGIIFDELDVIAVGWNYDYYKWQVPVTYGKMWFQYERSFSQGASDSGLHELISKQPGKVRKQIQSEVQKMNLGECPEITFVDHHLAHAASSFYASDFDQALVAVLDGSGEHTSTSVYLGNGQSLDLIESTSLPHSIGWFYAAFSAFLGFIPYEQDGFLMGLAPYGKLDRKLLKKVERVLWLEHNSIRTNPHYTMLGKHSHSEYFGDVLVEEFGKPRFRDEPLTQFHKNLARCVQHQLEQVVSSYLLGLMKEYKQEHLCLSGGVALNVKLNSTLSHSKSVKKFFAQPVSHDAGTAIGAGTAASPTKRITTTHMPYWGPQYSNIEVEKALTTASLTFTYHKSIATKAAKALAENKIVGWFQGRMEAGPRALGNRSILANPKQRSMHDVVNNKVKFRDSWRPFCPSVLEEYCEEYFVGCSRDDAYMIVAHPVRRNKQKDIPAVVHVDGSARPQVVSKKKNPLYHSLISEFHALSKLPVVLNTSLNVKGEPICMTPQDAIRCFYSTGMDCMALGNYWLEK